MSGLSSLDIAVITAELNTAVKDSLISNIYQLNDKMLLLKLRKRGEPKTNLIIEAGVELHVTAYDFERPSKPSNFCMALRKYLRNGRIREIRQYDFERIVELMISSKSGEYRLIVELFGDGNIILVDSENRILHALTYRRMRDRNIIRGETFKYPPPKGKDPRSISREDLEELRVNGRLEVVRSIVRAFGIGGKYAEEILARAGVDKNMPSSELKGCELNRIYESLMDLVSEFSVENETPSVYLDENGRWIDVSPIKMRKYSDMKTINFGSFNEALDEFYTRYIVEKDALKARRTAEEQIKRLERILEEQERAIKESTRRAEIYRRIGDAIYLHLNEIQFLMQRIMAEKRAGKSWNEISESLMKESRVPAAYFRGINPKAMTLRISVDDLTFDLDLKASAQENAARYYELAKKAERRARGAEEAMKETKAKIEDIRSRGAEETEKAELPIRIIRREWYERFRWFRSSEGFLVIGGRDRIQNEILIKKYMEPEDLVFHAEIPGAPFVLLKTRGGKPSEVTIFEAAQFAGSYSRAWREGLGSIHVYWVKPEQVSKSPPSGEYLSRGAFMIYGTRNYIRNVPLEVAIGVLVEDEGIRIIGGPPSAIAKHTGIYVKIHPGDKSSGELAKQIRDLLARMLSGEARKSLLKIPLDEIQRFIPPGGGSISRMDNT